MASFSPATATHPETSPRGGNDPRCVPIKLTAPIPIGDEISQPCYSEDEHAVWRELILRQAKLLPGRAADEFLSGLAALDLDRQRIPALADVSRKLHAATG